MAIHWCSVGDKKLLVHDYYFEDFVCGTSQFVSSISFLPRTAKEWNALSESRVCYNNSARMVYQWSVSDFTTVNLFVVDYLPNLSKLVKINHYEISNRPL